MKTAAVEIKGSILTVLVLQVNETDHDVLSTRLAEKFEKGSAFIAKAPVLIELNNIDEVQQCDFDLIRLIARLRELGVVPLAVRGAAACLESQAIQAGIGLLPDTKHAKSDRAAEADVEDVQQQTAAPGENGVRSANARSGTGYKTKVITKPVRSGQQVVAQGDLIVLSSVNAGAEVLARGNIHVYGALRGRALAGIDGDASARIFSMQFNPELVAVIGDYVVNESLDRKIINQSVMISRNADGLIFSLLGPGQPKM